MNAKACAPLDLRGNHRPAMLKLWRCTIRQNLRPGEMFPDIELVNENDELKICAWLDTSSKRAAPSARAPLRRLG
jgi:hypothetical protein